MADAYFLNESDKKTLGELVGWWRTRGRGDRGGGPYENYDGDGWQASDVYIAYCIPGIPAVNQENGLVSYAACEVYKLGPHPDLDGGQLDLSSAAAHDVYNVGLSAVPPESTILVWKDKFGTWIAGTQPASGATCIAVVTGTPTPEDDPPPGAFGDEWVPPRFQFHVYSIQPVAINVETGDWDDHPEYPAGVGYRAPSAPFVPPRIRVGDSVVAQIVPGYTNRYMIKGSSNLQTEFTFPTHGDIVCTQNEDGSYGPPTFVLFQSRVRLSGDGICLSQATSEE